MSTSPASEPRQEAAATTGPRALNFRSGQTIVLAGSVPTDWVAIRSGAVCLSSIVASRTRVATAILWTGDVIGSVSPVSGTVAHYEVTALVDVVAVSVPALKIRAGTSMVFLDEAMALQATTAARLQRQIAMRLAGNGVQRLVNVIATLATALAPDVAHLPTRLALPISQHQLGQLSGLSRRQTWIYLDQLTTAGWVTTARSKIYVEGLAAWLALQAAVDRNGLDSISTIERCEGTLSAQATAGFRRFERTLVPE